MIRFILGVVIMSSSFTAETFRNLGISALLPVALISYSWWMEIIDTPIAIAKAIAVAAVIALCCVGYVGVKKEDNITTENKTVKAE